LAPFGQAVSEEKICLTLANQKKELLLAAMFIGRMEPNEVSPETPWPNGTKLGRKHLCKILYKSSSYGSIWPPRAILFSDWLMLKKSSLGEKISLTLANQKQELLLAAIFVGQTERNEETL
jgi:hypothetical protein